MKPSYVLFFLCGPLRVFYAMHHRYCPGDYET